MNMVRVCHINVTNIRKHKDELLAKFDQYDIISVNETNLRSDTPFSFIGFNIFRNDRTNKRGGGVMLAVKQHIKCQEFVNKTIEKNEVIAVQTGTKSFKSILLASIYFPPQVKLNFDVFHE